MVKRTVQVVKRGEKRYMVELVTERPEEPERRAVLIGPYPTRKAAMAARNEWLRS